MTRRQSLISPVSLKEEYVELGTYSAKFILDPRRSQNTEIAEIMIVDADGKPMQNEVRRWGTKLHISFVINEKTPDGVALIDFVLGNGQRERFRFWVIK